ncbi:MAG: aldo/keto reductase [Thaumarchaeota archaeon]|nr:aldo/keto reductase [Nitrososphaerota archaeon]
MYFRTLGPDGPKVSRLCLGTNNFGKQLDEDGSKAIISKALEIGINFFDTSNVYNGGRSEEIIGNALHAIRSQVLIATKVGILTGEGPRTADLSRKYIERQVAESLKRLKSDYIDLYYVQRFDPHTPLEETLRTLDGLVKKNKVRYLGVSNFTLGQLEEALGICERLGLAKPVAVQPPYNLLNRDAEKDLFPYCTAHQMSVLTYSPLWGGFLTGKYQVGKPPPLGSRGLANRRYWDKVTKEGDFQTIERLRVIAEGAGVPLGKLALAWVLSNSSVTAPVVGASKPGQVVEYLGVLEMKVPDGALSGLERALAA